MANHQSFTPSVKVKNYQKKQEEYESAYQKAMANLASSPLGVGVQDALNAIANRTPFSYDFNADGLYAQYKNQYQKQGELAMQDTLARASELTGGYGNSYGVTAGMQAYQSQMENLNNMIPMLFSHHSTIQDPQGHPTEMLIQNTSPELPQLANSDPQARQHRFLFNESFLAALPAT